MPSAHLRLVVLCAFVVCMAPSFSRAQYTWVGGATGSGSLNFSSTLNWSGGAVPSPGNTTDLLFAGSINTGSSAARLSQDIAPVFTFRSIAFDASAGPFFITSNKFVTDNGGATLTQSSASDQFLSTQFASIATVNTTKTFTLTGTGTGVVTLAGSINDGSGTRKLALAKSGATATFVLAAPNSFTGGLTLSAGTLGIADPLALGNGTLGWSAGTLSLQTDSAVSFTAATSISGDVSLLANRATSGAGVTHVLGDLSLNASKLSVYAGGSVTSGTAGATFGTTTLTINGATFDVGATANLSLGTLSGNFSFTKQGAGTLTLSNQSTRNANTSITGGTVVVASATALGNGSSSTATISDATLQIAGVTVNNTKLTLNSNATLLGSGGSATYSNFNATIGAGANVRVATAAAADTLTLSAAVLGGNASSNIIVSGLGTVTLGSGSATGYAGAWNLNGASTTVLRVTDINSFGDNTGARPLTLTNGTLRLAVSAGGNFTASTTLAGNTTIIPERGSSGASITDSLGTLAVSDGSPAVGTITLTVNHGANFTSNNTGSLIFGATTLSDNVAFALNNTNGTAVGGTTLGALGRDEVRSAADHRRAHVKRDIAEPVHHRHHVAGRGRRERRRGEF